MIKFSHTVFALPFAFSAVILAQRRHQMIISDIFWILLAMIGARSSAMGFNRIADAKFDTKNPRTSKRDIPSGRLSLSSAIVFVILFSGLFIFSSAMLGKLCFYLSFPILVVLFSYSYTKRFTWLSHIYLGFAISLAPAGAWIALAKSFSWSILILSFALMTYIAGFDILYACQDIEFDKDEGLFSIPAHFGVKKALIIASIIHLASFCFFFLIYFVFDMNLMYFFAVVIIGILLIIEHRLVKPDDLSNVNFAFFHVNSLISITLFMGVLADELVRRWM
ncbi:MAG: putative 4-hydroxybenzoate polyprenyltransferase [Desulfobacterales bacterium]|nr:putative 4-hydroxybenzoate polyprenyltransferase [Desulfobacterales bacterium]MCD4804659.1 putative 4-hydroxybenzoate polyprenyltransferase [Desulfobacterales bacterium]